MKSRRRMTGILRQETAVAVATELESPAESRGALWERYLGFLRREGFNAEQLDLATKEDADELIEARRRLFGFAISGLAAAAMLATLTLTLGATPSRIGPAPTKPDSSEIYLPTPGLGSTAGGGTHIAMLVPPRL